MTFNLKTLSFIGFLVALIILTMVIAQVVLTPVVYAILLTLCLIPVCNFLESKKMGRLVSVILTLLAFFIILSGLIFIISVTFRSIFRDLPEIKEKLQQGLYTLNGILKSNIFLVELDIQDRLEENASQIISYFWEVIENSISASLATIGNFFVTFIYVFLLLLYRRGIKAILLGKSDKKRKSRLMKEVQQTVQQYVFGMSIVVLILGIMNTIGLWIIGIDYFPFWGFLAAGLIIIPYIGTTIGGIFPFLYALATTDTFWQPVAIVILYLTIQQIEGNFITPNIVGSKIDVNPLVVIFAMIVGGLIWGITGLILALPLIGILRIVLAYFDSTRSFGELMGNQLK